jgi:hypothetical protein
VEYENGWGKKDNLTAENCRALKNMANRLRSSKEIEETEDNYAKKIASSVVRSLKENLKFA